MPACYLHTIPVICNVSSSFCSSSAFHFSTLLVHLGHFSTFPPLSPLPPFPTLCWNLNTLSCCTIVRTVSVFVLDRSTLSVLQNKSSEIGALVPSVIDVSILACCCHPFLWICAWVILFPILRHQFHVFFLIPKLIDTFLLQFFH